jgi:hypothetical protein
MPSPIIRLNPRIHRADQWQGGAIEPRLQDVLKDPLVALVMRRDGVSAELLCAVIRQAQAKLRLPLCRRTA